MEKSWQRTLISALGTRNGTWFLHCRSTALLRTRRLKGQSLGPQQGAWHWPLLLHLGELPATLTMPVTSTEVSTSWSHRCNSGQPHLFGFCREWHIKQQSPLESGHREDEEEMEVLQHCSRALSRCLRIFPWACLLKFHGCHLTTTLGTQSSLWTSGGGSFNPQHCTIWDASLVLLWIES